MSATWIVVHSEDRNGEIKEHLIPTQWIIEISGSVNKGAYICLSEEMALTSIETIRDIAQMLDGEVPLMELLDTYKKKKGTKKTSVLNVTTPRLTEP